MSSPVAITRARVRSLTSPHEGDPGGDLAQLRQVPLDILPERDAEVCGQAPVALLDGAQLLVLGLADRGVQQPLESVGDAGDGRVHDQHARAGGAPLGDDARRCCSSWRGEETLVPPNFRTIQAEGGLTWLVSSGELGTWRAQGPASCTRAPCAQTPERRRTRALG